MITLNHTGANIQFSLRVYLYNSEEVLEIFHKVLFFRKRKRGVHGVHPKRSIRAYMSLLQIISLTEYLLTVIIK
jgi:hypothetical protein